MRLAISGSRDWPLSGRRELIVAFLSVVDQLKPDGYEIGDARGVDYILYAFLEQTNSDVNKHEAYWKRLGNYAGHERNGRVLLIGDALFAAPLGEANGTNNCIEQALKKGIPVYVYQNGEVKLHERSLLPKDDTLFGTESDDDQ